MKKYCLLLCLTYLLILIPTAAATTYSYSIAPDRGVTSGVMSDMYAHVLSHNGNWGISNNGLALDILDGNVLLDTTANTISFSFDMVVTGGDIWAHPANGPSYQVIAQGETASFEYAAGGEITFIEETREFSFREDPHTRAFSLCSFEGGQQLGLAAYDITSALDRSNLFSFPMSMWFEDGMFSAYFTGVGHGRLDLDNTRIKVEMENVPEPASLGLLLSALMGGGLLRKRSKEI